MHCSCYRRAKEIRLLSSFPVCIPRQVFEFLVCREQDKISKVVSGNFNSIYMAFSILLRNVYGNIGIWLQNKEKYQIISSQLKNYKQIFKIFVCMHPNLEYPARLPVPGSYVLNWIMIYCNHSSCWRGHSIHMHYPSGVQ